VEQQPPNTATDHLRSIAGGALVESHPEDALAMVSKISDPAQRDDSLAHLLRRWVRDDSAAAQAWIAQAKLSPAVVGRVKIPQK